MSDIPLQVFKDAIYKQHRCDSSWVAAVPVKELAQGKVIWQGTVQVFSLKNHPTAKRCFAWSEATSGRKRRFLTVLSRGPIDSPHKAVQAVLAAETPEADDASAWALLLPNLPKLIADLAEIDVGERRPNEAAEVVGHLVEAATARNKRQRHPKDLDAIARDSMIRLWKDYKSRVAEPDANPEEAAKAAVGEELATLMDILKSR